MKKMIGYVEHKQVERERSKAILLWEEQTAQMVIEQIEANKPIDIYSLMAKTLTPEILAGFKMIEIISIKESCDLTESRAIYLKLTTEIIIRFAKSQTKLCYLLATLSVQDIQGCLELLVGYEEYEIVCTLRDEINNRK
jgi:hypothetical protein